MAKPGRRTPKKSLRTILMLWFLLFAVVPLAFITGYSVVKFEQAIDQELGQRLAGNSREISSILREYEAALALRIVRHASDIKFIYAVSSGGIGSARMIAREWLRSPVPQKVNVFDRTGRQIIALYRTENDEIEQDSSREGGLGLKPDFLAQMDQLTHSARLVEFNAAQKSVDLILFQPIRNANGNSVGYLEELISLNEASLLSLKKRLGIELVIFDRDQKVQVATYPDFYLFDAKFLKQLSIDASGFFDLTVRDHPHGFMRSRLKWGDQAFEVVLGASKRQAKNILRDVNTAFFTVVGTVVLFLITLSVITSRLLLKPLDELLVGIEKMDPENADEPVEIETKNQTELGLLSESFNQMSLKVFNTQRELKQKITELEQANQEIKDTQAKLVHTTKMASLGQLVAGVAHELNNPIGFIYSNMQHLRDYSQKLIRLVDIAESNPEELKNSKTGFDFDYIVTDLPKLIQSCEDGARRVRDIVIGLRNFSRLEEAKLKEVDLHEGLDNTLRLLSGETKNRIVVKKDFGPLPPVTCYPSELNQVFMNILSNAAQAIEGAGEIRIQTAFDQPSDRIRIDFWDSGHGISKAHLDKIFDPFFTTKPVGRGTGLGLSISYGIIKKHGGEIMAESTEGQGTHFILILPRTGPGAV